MKKMLLTAAAAAFALTSFGQNCDNPGFSGTGIYDDFAQTTPYGDENGGIYVWGDKDASEPGNDGFGATHVRDSINGELDITVTTKLGGYTPTGIGFGDTEGTGLGDPYTIDLSNDATVALTITNNGDSAIKVRVLLQDVNQNDIDSKPAGTQGWDELFEANVAAGATVSYSEDHTGGKKAVYGSSGFDGYDDTSFDMSKVRAIMFTVINANSNANFQPYPLVDYPLSISDLKVGACPDPVGLSNSNEVAYEVYPNPASENVQFSQELNDVTVFDALGNVIETSATSSNLNVSNYNTGIYFIKSAEGTTQFVVE